MPQIVSTPFFRPDQAAHIKWDGLVKSFLEENPPPEAMLNISSCRPTASTCDATYHQNQKRSA